MNFWAKGLGHEQFKEKPHAYYGREMIIKEMAEFTKDSDFEERSDLNWY